MSLSYTRVRVECPAIPEGAEVREVTGREAISELFDVEVVVVCGEGASIDVGEVVSAPVTIVFEQRDASGGGPHFVERRRIHGAVYQCDDLLQPDDRHATYALRIGPRVWLTRLVETLDVLLGMSVPEILRSKLGQVELVEGEDFVLRLNEPDYEAREMVVQYKETDLAFLSRLCEHVGVGFTFEHDDGRDVLVFCDDNAVYPEIAEGGAVRFAGRGERAGVFELRESTRIVPRHFVQRDYNYRSPQVDLTGSAEMPDGFGGGVVEYGGHFKTPAEGDWLATIRSQEQRCRRRRFTGVGSDARLAAGRRVRVEGHPRGDVELLITDVTYAIRQSTMMGGDGGERAYEVKFGAVSATNTFRPQRVTPRPRVGGVLNGIVEGEGEGKYAHIDEHGRYRVRFMFDTSGKGEAKASHCVRMMQPSSGAGYGVHFPLRPGTEVLIAFVDGDPDRPIIAGTVPNAETASPVNATNAPKNVIRTGGGNAIDIDDTEDGQRVKISSPRFGSVIQIGEPNEAATGIGLFSTANATTLVSGSASTASSYSSMWGNFTSNWGNHVMNFAGAMTPMTRLESYTDHVAGQLAFASAAVQIGISSREWRLDRCKEAREEAEETIDPLRRALEAPAAEMDGGCDPAQIGLSSKARDAMTRALDARRYYEETIAALATANEERAAIGAARTEAIDGGLDQQAEGLALDAAAADARITLLEGEVQHRWTHLKEAVDRVARDAGSPCSDRASAYLEAAKLYEHERKKLQAIQREEMNEEKGLQEDGDYKRAKAAAEWLTTLSDWTSTGVGTLWDVLGLALGDSLKKYTNTVIEQMIADVAGQRSGKGSKLRVSTPGDLADGIEALNIKAVPKLDPVSHVQPTLGLTARTPWTAMAETTKFKDKPKASTEMKVKAALMLAIPVAGPYYAQKMLADEVEFNEGRNVLGSEAKTVVFGKEAVFVHGTEYATVSSSNAMLLSADNEAVLHARANVEVAGGLSAKITSSTLVDVLSRGVARVATTDASAPNESWFDGDLKDKVLCELEMKSGKVGAGKADRGAVKLVANQAGGAATAASLEMTNDAEGGQAGTLKVLVGDPDATNVTLEAKGGTVKLSALHSNAAGALSINAEGEGVAQLGASKAVWLKAMEDDDGPTILLDTNDGISIACGNASITMNDDGICLKFKDATLVLDASGATMAFGGPSITVDGSAITLDAPKVQGGG